MWSLCLVLSTKYYVYNRLLLVIFISSLKLRLFWDSEPDNLRMTDDDKTKNISSDKCLSCINISFENWRLPSPFWIIPITIHIHNSILLTRARSKQASEQKVLLFAILRIKVSESPAWNGTPPTNASRIEWSDKHSVWQ